MIAIRWVLSAALIPLVACGGASSISSAETSQTLPDASGSGTNAQQTSDSQPALIDASTDIDAIDQPVVLWFWSPG